MCVCAHTHIYTQTQTNETKPSETAKIKALYLGSWGCSSEDTGSEVREDGNFNGQAVKILL
jgi:hypothetical protein